MFASQDEKRSTERYDYAARIEYVLDSHEPARIFKAVIINISESGMGIYTFWPFQAGQEIVIKSLLPVGPRRATICWIKQEQQSMYKMGLKFKNRMERDRQARPQM